VGKLPVSELFKLRMKVGEHEFEATGRHEQVIAQLEGWKQLTALSSTSALPGGRATINDDAPTRKLFAIDAAKQLLTLRIKLAGQRRNPDAALLLLYAFRTWLAPDGVGEMPAERLKAALVASGYRPKRLDRAIAPYLERGWIHQSGRYRRIAYTLTTAGLEHADAVVSHLAKRL